MTERIKEIYQAARGISSMRDDFMEPWEFEYAKLIVRECVEQVEQAKNSLFVSLDDAKRMSHFVDVTTKKITKHFGVE